MRLMELTETRSYKLFDVGERVKPTAGVMRCDLERGIYVVMRCEPPLYLEDEASVILDGQSGWYSTKYLISIDDPVGRETEKPPAGEGGREGEG